MIFNPSERKKVVSCNFPVFTANGEELSYASSFKYLGSVITNDLRDDADIEREIKYLFMSVRSNACSPGAIFF